MSMTVKTKSNVNLKALDALRSLFDGEKEVRVGIMGSDVPRPEDDGQINNAELGMVQEFGSITNNIPSRSFLRMPISTKQKQIAEQVVKGRGKIEEGIADGNADAAYDVLAVAAEAVVQQAFETGGYGKWQQNKPDTIKRKGSSAPLIDSGELRSKVTSKVVKKS